MKPPYVDQQRGFAAAAEFCAYTPQPKRARGSIEEETEYICPLCYLPCSSTTELVEHFADSHPA
jgi:hypothetical protein